MKSAAKRRENLMRDMNKKKLQNNISENKADLYIANPRGYTLKTVEICNNEKDKYV